MFVTAAIFKVLVIVASASGSSKPHGASAPHVPVTNDLQAKIVQFYSDGNCAEVRSMAKTIDLMALRPNVMAITAFCDPPGVDAEALFAKAEKLSPTGDLIFVLHAKHRWKKNPKAAEPLWERVLMIARNEYFREMARDYLSKVVDPGTAETPLNLSPSTGFGQFFIGAEHRSNAQPPDFVYQPSASSYAGVVRGDLTYRHWYGFGSFAVHYLAAYEQYFSAAQYTLWSNNLELPLALHISSNKDLIVRPFTGYSRIGGAPLQLLYGIGVAGAVYNENYTQSVQGIVYADHIFVPAIAPEQGSHYRFEYQWDIYPRNWFLSTTLALEHVSGTPATQLFGNSGTFEMSHTDGIVDLKVERNFTRFTLSFAPHLVFRDDSQATTYFLPAIGGYTSKQRRDLDASLQGDVTVPLLRSLQLYAWYEWRRIFSNFGVGDYVNRNFSDQTVGVGVKTSLSTY